MLAHQILNLRLGRRIQRVVRRPHVGEFRPTALVHHDPSGQ
jgi:hypothetical protein